LLRRKTRPEEAEHENDESTRVEVMEGDVACCCTVKVVVVVVA
jgi:hypothetical protein